ncbi:copper-binding protein [Rhodoferax mekongensis]|uniref:Copper-binding protein n=1 Tax=Rhodoferax mekongensis TaxID=3068341 RepID=A0ABZ0AWS2_9BURK|nr:copper-binding protein [Rhodoferax sp. TBRC 17307]WNO03588.1 copper-binding protein [Rhodoferax sp. TBRC 17307]
MKHWILAIVLACTTSVWAAPDWTQARIVTLEPERPRVTLKHQRIESIGMEAMTMPFKVDGAIKLDSFKVGQKVRFTVAAMENHLVVDQMEPVK